jgi:hypothetical protein
MPSEHGAAWRNRVALAICIVGCVQMIGYIVDSDVLRGVGAATAASPMPKVFSDVDGLEPFASHFTLRYTAASGRRVARPITPALYGRLTGPYNRRNVYGAALSYAPRLPRELWEPVYCYALAPAGPLRSELGIEPDATNVTVTIRTLTRDRNDIWTLEVPCPW